MSSRSFENLGVGRSMEVRQDPPEEGSDGVVPYRSAHIEGVAPELIVCSGHSTPSHPRTIEDPTDPGRARRHALT